MHNRVINNIIGKIFREKEILSKEKFYRFINIKKIVVFIPDEYVEKVYEGMSMAGAGIIGNYEMCSFRTSGTGTFKPLKTAKPFSGKKNDLSKVSEVKLEMECNPGDVNKILDALMKNHPYEETVYEIYDFKKRESKESGLIIKLKSEMSLKVLFSRMNKRLIYEEKDSNKKFSKIVILDSEADETILDSVKFTDSNYLISADSKSDVNYKLYKIN
jgi:hypothetical protein